MRTRKHLGVEEKPFDSFWKDYEVAMTKFKMHRFKYLILGKRFCGDVRKESLMHGECGWEHDFAEALSLKHCGEIQSMHFSSLSVSIEGYSVHYRKYEEHNTITLDFHSFLCDDKTQMSNTVYYNMKKLVEKLMEQGTLKKGGRILASTDGCAKQYKCCTSLYYMSLVATTFEITMDRAIQAPGHGKSLVDAINGVDKNTIMRRSRRTVSDSVDDIDSKSSNLKIESYNNVVGEERYSAAADCKRILEQDGGEGVKSVVMTEKKNSKRGINQRHWHVRELSHKLKEIKCARILIPDSNLSFQDMYHYHTCKGLGAGRAALKQIPCNCNACDETIRLPWKHGVACDKQPRFAMAKDCFLRPILGDSNRWYIVDIKLAGKCEEEEADEAHSEVLHNVTTAVANCVVIGEFGAVATDAIDAPDGYYLVEFTGLPYTDQDDGLLKCNANWLSPFKRARHWYINQPGLDTVIDMITVVSTSVEMLPLSASNMPPNQRTAIGAMKITEDAHHFIGDEILLRDRLEYDPSRVFDDPDEEEDEEEIEVEEYEEN